MSDSDWQVIEEETYVCQWKILRDSEGREMRLLTEEGKKPPHLLVTTDYERLANLAAAVRKFKREPSPKELQIIYESLSEFEEIWLAIKALRGRVDAGDPEKWKTAALNRFSDSPQEWKYSTRELLKEIEYEIRRPGHEKGDLRGNFLQKVLESQGYERHGARPLEELAKQLDQKT